MGSRRRESLGSESGTAVTPGAAQATTPKSAPVAVLRLASALVMLVSVAACERETRRFREAPPTITADPVLRQSELQPGSPVREVNLRSEHEENAWAIAEGKRLYGQFNCVGCHAEGGGAIGPALMDEEWIYGSEPENIYATIVQGRPNGMPAFGGKIAASQVWQLVGYVRAMNGWIRKDVAPGRSDAMYVKPQEQATEEQQPRQSFTPPLSERP